MHKHLKDGDGLVLVRFKVDELSGGEFQIWKAKAENLVKAFKGFIGLTVLDRLNDIDDYIIIVRFDNEENAGVWLHSEIRVQLIDDAGLWLTENREVLFDWNIFWYRIFEGTKKWKQWVITFIAVYPLTIIIPFVVKILAGIIPLYFFAGVISALLISGFMIYLLMPFVSKLFKKWLHV
jgi:uncharacterized protein